MPQLVSVLVLDGREESEFLVLAGSLAWMVSHPLGAAIVDGADGVRTENSACPELSANRSRGVSERFDKSPQRDPGKVRLCFAELGLSLNSLDDSGPSDLSNKDNASYSWLWTERPQVFSAL